MERKDQEKGRNLRQTKRIKMKFIMKDQKFHRKKAILK